MSGKPPPDAYCDNPPPARSDLVSSQGVSLGCGTLILIALIVMIFSGGDTKKVEGEVRDLRSEVAALKVAIDAQTEQLKAIQERLERPQ